MNRLKELRLINNLTQKDISLKTNMPQSTYNNYENGKREPNIETLINLANYYNVSLDYLVGRSFGNELGFLTEFQYTTIKCFLMLTEQNQAIINGRILALLENQ